MVAEIAGLQEALLYRPVEHAPDHPFQADGPGPPLVLELRFSNLAETEAALASEALGRLPERQWSHQAFAAHDFAVPDPLYQTAEPCTFLVQYPGPSPDPRAWLEHYDAHHPPIMARFPGVRRVATYWPVRWTSRLGWVRADLMQRNKVAFDSPGAIAAALASPVMAEMRADRNAFPPFEGGAAHYPMRTQTIQAPSAPPQAGERGAISI